MPLGTEVGLGLGDIVLDGDPAPLPRKWAQQPTLLWHGRPSQQLLSSQRTAYRQTDRQTDTAMDERTHTHTHTAQQSD